MHTNSQLIWDDLFCISIFFFAYLGFMIFCEKHYFRCRALFISACIVLNISLACTSCFFKDCCSLFDCFSSSSRTRILSNIGFSLVLREHCSIGMFCEMGSVIADCCDNTSLSEEIVICIVFTVGTSAKSSFFLTMRSKLVWFN